MKGPNMAQLEWKMLHPKATLAHLGVLPGFLDDAKQARAAKQLGDGYAQYGGWRPQKGFKLTASNCLVYPGDPPNRPVAEAKLRDETILFYADAYVAVVQSDRSFEVCRMD